VLTLSLVATAAVVLAGCDDSALAIEAELDVSVGFTRLVAASDMLVDTAALVSGPTADDVLTLSLVSTAAVVLAGSDDSALVIEAELDVSGATLLVAASDALVDTAALVVGATADDVLTVSFVANAADVLAGSEDSALIVEAELDVSGATLPVAASVETAVLGLSATVDDVLTLSLVATAAVVLAGSDDSAIIVEAELDVSGATLLVATSDALVEKTELGISATVDDVLTLSLVATAAGVLAS
jgi:hypothetical protein